MDTIAQEVTNRGGDLWPLSIARWSTPERRDEHMGRLYAAFADSRDWSMDKQCRVGERIGILTVNRIVSSLSRLPAAIRAQCRDARTYEEAQEAAYEAGETPLSAALADAWTVRIAAAWATVHAAAWADDADAVLIAAVDLWIAASEE